MYRSLRTITLCTLLLLDFSMGGTCTGDQKFPKILYSDTCTTNCNANYYSAITANSEALFLGGHVAQENLVHHSDGNSAVLTRIEIDTKTMTYSMGYNADIPITVSALALSPDDNNLAVYAHDLQSDPKEGGDFGFIFTVSTSDGRLKSAVGKVTHDTGTAEAWYHVSSAGLLYDAQDNIYAALHLVGSGK